MAKEKRRRASSHMGGNGKEYNGKAVTAPLTPEEKKKYAHLLNKNKKK